MNRPPWPNRREPANGWGRPGEKTDQDAPGAIFSRGVATWVSPLFPRLERVCVLHRPCHGSPADDDVAAAPHRIASSLARRKEERTKSQHSSHQLSTKSDQIHRSSRGYYSTRRLQPAAEQAAHPQARPAQVASRMTRVACDLWRYETTTHINRSPMTPVRFSRAREERRAVLSPVGSLAAASESVVGQSRRVSGIRVAVR